MLEGKHIHNYFVRLTKKILAWGGMLCYTAKQNCLGLFLDVQDKSFYQISKNNLKINRRKGSSLKENIITIYVYKMSRFDFG